jgi:RNA-directed DNA polymerase
MNPSTIKNSKQLAGYLRCEQDFLEAYLGGDYIINDRKEPTITAAIFNLTSVIDKLYLRKKEKQNNSYREIYSIRTDMLKSTLKTFNTFLQSSFNPSPAVHGYVTGRNIRTNAERHLARKYLLSVDIYRFFESITTAMVEQALLRIGFSAFASKNLAQFVTISNFLPPGFNTSPAVSNLIAQNMDEHLISLCGRNCTYTRYADDLYFSSNIEVPSLQNIEEIVGNSGFVLNSVKTKYMPRGGKQYVTGLTVFDHVRPHITRKIKRNLRLELYHIKEHGLLQHVLYHLGHSENEYIHDETIRSKVNGFLTNASSRIEGWIHFMKSVERPAALKLEAIYKGTKQ